MNIYKDLEDSLYNLVSELFSEWRVIFAFGNGPEPVTPYCVIDIKKLDTAGQQYTSHLGQVDPVSGDAVTVTFQDAIAQVRFEFIGKYDENTTTAEMAQQLQFAIRTPKGFELLKINRLALHGKLSTRRIPVKRETDMYMVYQLDGTFAYCSMTADGIGWIASTDITGVYHDAGREPDHVIPTHIEIITPNGLEADPQSGVPK